MKKPIKIALLTSGGIAIGGLAFIGGMHLVNTIKSLIKNKGLTPFERAEFKCNASVSNIDRVILNHYIARASDLINSGSSAVIIPLRTISKYGACSECMLYDDEDATKANITEWIMRKVNDLLSEGYNAEIAIGAKNSATFIIESLDDLDAVSEMLYLYIKDTSVKCKKSLKTVLGEKHAVKADVNAYEERKQELPYC